MMLAASRPTTKNIMTISRQALFGKLGVQLYRGIESATNFCKLRGNPFVELVHWLHQLLQHLIYKNAHSTIVAIQS